MAEAIIFEVKGVDEARYHKVNEILGTEGGLPDGLISHTGAIQGDSVIVFEVWESRAKQEAFMSELGPALGQAGVPQPSRMEWFTVIGQMGA
jgi:hypothetical protein